MGLLNRGPIVVGLSCASGVWSSSPGLCPLSARGTSLPSCDNQILVQTEPGVPVASQLSVTVCYCRSSGWIDLRLPNTKLKVLFLFFFLNRKTFGQGRIEWKEFLNTKVFGKI